MKNTKLYILNLGRGECDTNLLVASSVLGTRSNPTPKINWDWFPMDAILIDHPEGGKILFDLGCHPDAMKGRWPKSLQEVAPFFYEPEQTIERQLGLCGVKPEDIKTVILSHMHLDHAGSLYLFPHANVIVHKDEFAAAFAYAFEQWDQEGHAMYIRNDINVPIDKYTLIKEDTELFKGIKILVLPSHTVGHCGLQIELEHFGTMIFTRDACNTSANYGPPVRPPGFVDNFAIYNNSIEKVRKIAEETNAFVVFGHDQKQFLTLKHAPDYYD